LFKLEYAEGDGDRSATLKSLARINDRISDLAEASPQLDDRFRERVREQHKEILKQEREKLLKQEKTC
jgi:hypothetical protein